MVSQQIRDESKQSNPMGGGRSRRRPFSNSRLLRVESLEDRRLLANVTVSNLNDVVDGNVSSIAALIATPGADGSISLREAIRAANADTAADTIGFSVTGIINLSATGQLEIDNHLTINGPGANLLTIRAYDPSAATFNGTRVFLIDGHMGLADKIVSINGVTLTGGDVNSDGGAIFSLEILSMSGSIIEGNRALGGGGGIFGSGPGIFDNVFIQGCIVRGNSSSSFGGGGGIDVQGGRLNVTDSTISGNSSSLLGGGGISVTYGAATITNTTISGNLADGYGGGLAINYSPVTVAHSTITANQADRDNNGNGAGGGIFCYGIPVNLNQTIVSGNTNGVATKDDIYGPAAARFSIIGVDTDANITNSVGNQIGTDSSPVNAMLGSLTNNGGFTETRALLAGSPAINTGDHAFVSPPANDQRGAPYVRVSGGRIDIGAYEVQTAAPSQPGDYNRDNGVNAADYVYWRKLLGATGWPANTPPNGDGDTTVDDGDYGVWRENFGESLPGSGGADGSRVEGRGSSAGVVVQASTLSSGEMAVDAERSMPVFATANLRSERLAYVAAPVRDADGWGSARRVGRETLTLTLSQRERESSRDRALAAWLASHGDGRGRRLERVDGDILSGERFERGGEAIGDDVDAVFDSLSLAATDP